MTVHPVGARPQLAFKMPTISFRTVMEPQEHVLRAVTCTTRMWPGVTPRTVPHLGVGW